MDNTPHNHELIGDNNFCVICGPEKKAVTREEYLVANNYGKEELFFQLLTERDEALKLKERYQKLAGEIQVRFEEERRWKEAYRDVAINLVKKYQRWPGYVMADEKRAPGRVDAAARRIVEGKCQK